MRRGAGTFTVFDGVDAENVCHRVRYVKYTDVRDVGVIEKRRACCGW